MNDFIVTLPSRSNKREFPANEANHFKIRLAQLLHLPASGWKVGLSSISLPDSKVNIYHLAEKGKYVFSAVWIKRVDGSDYQGGGACLLNDLQKLDSIADGVSFMKAMIYSLEQQRAFNEADIGGSNIMGNQVTDMLREVKYERKGQRSMFFERLHVQYRSIRNEFIEIIETQKLTMTDAVPAHQRSEATVNPALQVFEVPPTDASINAYRMVTIQPLTTGINPMELAVNALDDCVDLGRSYFSVELTFKKSDGNNLLAADKL
ncbi:hypothetical protein OS493_021992 [Desmophyllum pertusum]|uniref:Uncharacterized protein n=1 Tax=Desmophyllum pertusum TaxID=174260 RepID=A0A9X0CQG2_9CNID|nr:hypothetical protein OS493_021992 [Desmophyllum pertusum]